MKTDTDTIVVMEQPQTKRLTLADPKEFAIIKSVYFGKDNSFDEKEIAERINRAQIRRKNFGNQSR